MMKVFGIDFISGDETYDADNIDAMKGTYWYVPVPFMEGILDIIKKKQNTKKSDFLIEEFINTIFFTMFYYDICP